MADADLSTETGGSEPSATPGEKPGKKAKPSWGPYGRRPAKVLAGVAFIDAVDRGILPGVLTQVQDDLGFSDTQAGLLGTAFVLTGFLVVLPAGYLADRYRRTRIIAVVLASWGLISGLNALVRSFWQFLAVRAALGIGETIDNPASQSLIADYYPTDVRGRAFALQRATPFFGQAIGLALAGGIAAVLSWRWAFLLVGVPGSILALLVWRLPEPKRGESDVAAEQPDPVLPVAAPSPPERDSGPAALFRDVMVAARVRTLRSLMIGSAIAAGALSGLGFWAAAYYDRHTTMSSGLAAGLVGGLILIGAISGTFVAGGMVDKLRDRYEGAPMLLAGTCQGIGACLLIPSFLEIPLWLRIPMQGVAVAFIVGGLVAIPVMITEVVAPTIRGIAFSVTGFLSAMAGAASPLIIGFVADRFEYVVDGEVRGNLANAFLIVTPLILVGAAVLLQGRRHVAGDIARASAAR
ncbi:MAG: spinster family MFS transporter [Acidimicrobiales bacterium]